MPPRLVTVRDFNTSRYSQMADTSNANLSDVLARAEAAVESQLKRPLLPTTYTEVLTSRKGIIYPTYRPILSVTSIERFTVFVGMPMDVLSLDIDSGAGMIYLPHVADGSRVRVTYVAGFDEVPEDIKEAIMIQAAWFLYQDLEIYGSGDSKEPGIMYIKRDIKELLAPYKLLHIAN